MPVNKKGKGGKRVRRGKKHPGIEESEAQIPFKNDQQEYAQVIKLLGNMHIMARIFGDGKEKLCVIPGKFKKKVWINKEDIILISVRSFQDDKCDVIHKYSPNEARKLIKFGEIIADESIIVNDKEDQNDDNIEVLDDQTTNDNNDPDGEESDQDIDLETL